MYLFLCGIETTGEKKIKTFRQIFVFVQELEKFICIKEIKEIVAYKKHTAFFPVIG